MEPTWQRDGIQLYLGRAEDVLPTLEAGSFDAVVTDPPYSLGEPRSGGNYYHRPRTEEEKQSRRGGFMGKAWDDDVAFRPETWRLVLPLLKPGGYLLAFGGTRTWHRLACALEDAGFEMRDTLCWLYGSGFPKGKGCLKPAWEPVLFCRKPGPRVLPLGIDETRIPCEPIRTIQGQSSAQQNGQMYSGPDQRNKAVFDSHPAGRWPANCVHDGSGEVLEAFAAFGESESKTGARGGTCPGPMGWGQPRADGHIVKGHSDTGTAARFFYTAKASRAERGEGNTHPTVKPLALLRWLVRLVTPPGALCLDPFGGSGTTALACLAEGRRCVMVEREADYFAIARRRLEAGVEAALDAAPLFSEQVREEQGLLFGGDA